jgi:outer membrane protein assembly factor BamB
MFDIRLIKPTKALLVLIILASLTLSACIGSRGWPGTVSEGDTLYVGTMQGKLFYLNSDSGARKWEWEPGKKTDNTTSSASSFLSCGAGGTGQFKGGASYDAPAVANGTIYIGYYTGMVYAIDATRGMEVWDYDLKSYIAAGLTVADGTVFVGSSNGKLSALDAGSGALKWEFPTKNEVWTKPVVADGVVYFGSLDHNLYAVDIETHELKWKEPFGTDGGIASSPIVVDGVVYFGSFDKKFYAVNADSGSLKWVFDEAGNWYWSQALYNDGIVYACCLDNNVYALNAGNGTPAWTQPFDAGASLRSSPVIAGGVLVVASKEGKVFGLDLETGAQKWQFDNIKSRVFSSLCTDGNRVYINSQDNRLYALDGETGRQDWNVSLAK